MKTSITSALSTSAKVVALAVAALTLTVGTAEAQHRGGPGFRGGPAFHGPVYRGPVYHHGGWGPGWVLGGIGIGLGVAAASNYYYNAPYGYTYGAPVYYSAPPATVIDPAYVDPGPAPAPTAPVQSSAAPAPIFYPRNGQSATQTEQDRQDCNRWAATQQSALNDANIFQRATLACMDGRGYTVR